MNRIVYSILIALSLFVTACGGSREEKKSVQELNEAQSNDQKAVDDAEKKIVRPKNKK